jgi:uncharacterized protein
MFCAAPNDHTFYIAINPAVCYTCHMHASFEWDEDKNQENQSKHGVSFEEAQKAFRDPNRLIIKDSFHSINEDRWFCVGDIGTGIVTVRFTYRERTNRIFGAGYWRRLRKMYLQEQGNR